MCLHTLPAAPAACACSATTARVCCHGAPMPRKSSPVLVQRCGLQEGAELVMRQACSLASGERAAIHTADMRREVGTLTWL